MLLYYLRWSLLYGFSKSLWSKVLFLLSLTPVLVHLLRFLEFVDGGSLLFRIKMAVMGAIIFFVSYLCIKISIPEQIREHSDSNVFSEYAKNNISSPVNYFKNLDNLLEKYGDYCPNTKNDKQRLQQILPPSEAVNRLGKQGASLELSKAYYQLLDCSKPILRNVLGLMLFLSWSLMFFSLLRNMYIILLW